MRRSPLCGVWPRAQTEWFSEVQNDRAESGFIYSAVAASWMKPLERLS